MNKSELVSAVAQELGFTQKDTEAVIRSALSKMTESLVSGEKVALSGFGTFEVRHKSARVGKNPRTKQAIRIPAFRSVVFKSGKNLKEELSK